MPPQATSAKVSPVHREFTPLPAVLSYLVPGLGQIAQGRIGKGLLFFVCVMSLFFYGQYLGNWSNVYLPDTSGEPKQARHEGQKRSGSEALKPNIALMDYQGKTLNELQSEGDKRWDLGWVFTVIAGVLNVMIIYDALAGPAFVVTRPEESSKE